MALAKKCDRCEKSYEHYPVGNQPGGIMPLVNVDEDRVGE